MKNENPFLDEIFDIESKALLGDLASVPELIFLLMDFDEDKILSAVSYIKSIFQNCYALGHLKLAIFCSSDVLMGYAMFFVIPGNNTSYLHKIFVQKPYRYKGIGTKILTSLLNEKYNFVLLCPHEKIPFYKGNGFLYCGEYKAPYGENFKFSKNMYLGLSLMSNMGNGSEAPVFLLNDDDIKKILEV